MRTHYTWLFILCMASFSARADWPQFRGPFGSSYAPDARLPEQWTGDDVVAWQVELPGRGPSSPIVVGDHVFVTCSDGVKQDRLLVLAFAAEDGRLLWRREFWATGRTLTHPFSAVAAPTPASDGERIFAFFASNDLICLDLDGNLLWYRGLAYDHPKAGNDAGMGSSPVVADETVVVQIENQGDSFAAGLDVRTGKSRWEIPRDRVASWSSPLVLPKTLAGEHVVLLQSARRVTAHRILSGDQLWEMEMPFAAMVSPVAAGDFVLLPSQGITALKVPSPDQTPEVAWSSSRLGVSAASPIVADDLVYTINGAGVLSCAELQTGRSRWQTRIGGRHWSTPVLAGERMYCFNQDGQVRIVRLGARGQVVSSADLGETILASPAVDDRSMYVRSDRHLWKIMAP